MLNVQAIDEARRLLPLVAPELPEPYIFEHPAHLPTPVDCGAYAPKTTDPLLRDHLIARGEWTGPRPMIVMVESSRVNDDVLGTILHEAAHHLPFVPLPADEEPTDATRAEWLELTTAWASHKRESKVTPAWMFGHGKEFVRTCLHLHFRAIWHWHAARVERWQSLTIEHLRFAGGGYHLSDPHEYKRALGKEAGVMLDATFAEILSTPAPPAFLELFEADYRRWQEWTKQQPQPEKPE